MRSRDWAPWLVALGAGVAVGWWWGRRSDSDAALDGDLDDGWVERWGDRVDTAVEMAGEGLRLMDRRLRGASLLSDRSLADALSGVEGAETLRAHALGPGVIDLTGEADDPVAQAARAALEALPGVEVVLNRIWTPSSADPGLN
ncbi:MAG: hypothetical protein KJO11_14630 [Gemmatimonadetes bacterium]|nr:hypothetical protein [Gemmatimonadota bacterium]MBT8402567.1 hypothetical protein [Gemmatimonadota bacterium]NNF39195.1 hypothetical protein [Gemmatimonadota bacterium]NNK61564.1 hypothetical protein [Gemmatimonadota bacterium]